MERRVKKEVVSSSSTEESHPRGPTKLNVNLSVHPALIAQPLGVSLNGFSLPTDSSYLWLINR
jgi:hypothetical protein